MVVGALTLGGAVAGCDGTTDPDVALRDRFNVERPGRVNVLHYEGTGFSDASDVWVLAPVDDAFLRDLIAAAGLARWTVSEPRVTGLGATWPAWWPDRQIEALPEVYHRERPAGDEAREYWRVWVDRTHDRIYVQWFDT